jgi:UDP-arabinose 4-epimerase
VTGGAGFIGSHTCKRLAASGFEPVAYDNLSTGNRASVKWGPLVEADIRDTGALKGALSGHGAVAVVHFAASAYVGESVAEPDKYYDNNVLGTLSVLKACREAGIGSLVFSSSCATYGEPAHVPIAEDAPQNPINPYGRTKLVGEWMIEDFSRAYGLRAVVLRYFNASGADPDHEIGEWHNPETHIIPRTLMAALGSSSRLEVFGDDYPTDDGTCVRDFVHVSDLATAHVMAIEHLLSGGANLSLNIGTGKGTSIREVVASVERITGRGVPTVTRSRRAGDPPILIADARRAAETFGFHPRHSDIDTIIATAAPFFMEAPR